MGQIGFESKSCNCWRFMSRMRWGLWLGLGNIWQGLDKSFVSVATWCPEVHNLVNMLSKKRPLCVWGCLIFVGSPACSVRTDLNTTCQRCTVEGTLQYADRTTADWNTANISDLKSDIFSRYHHHIFREGPSVFIIFKKQSVYHWFSTEKDPHFS